MRFKFYEINALQEIYTIAAVFLQRVQKTAAICRILQRFLGPPL